jgi:hypothetical protein
MNYQVLYLLACILCYLLPVTAHEVLDNHKQFKIKNQSITDRFDIFWKPVKYSQSSIKCFIKHSYNNLAYAPKFLAFGFGYHIVPLLSYAHLNQQPRAYIKSIIKLFGQKSKSTPYINAFSYFEFLETLPPLLSPYCVVQQKDYMLDQESIKQCLYNFFLTDFNSLKTDPESAFNKLSVAICQQLQQAAVIRKEQRQDISIKELQYDMFHFLEITLSKLIWSAQDQKSVWESVKAISAILTDLQQHNILPSLDSLDELFWTLISRFCYFLEIEGAELNEPAFHAISQDLASGDLLLWTLPEREAYITTKAKSLKTALISAEIRSRAYKMGLITDLIPRLSEKK